MVCAGHSYVSITKGSGSGSKPISVRPGQAHTPFPRLHRFGSILKSIARREASSPEASPPRAGSKHFHRAPAPRHPAKGPDRRLRAGAPARSPQPPRTSRVLHLTTSRVSSQGPLGPRPSTGLNPCYQEKVHLPRAGPSSPKLSQGRAEMVGECCQDAGRTKTWRVLAESFVMGSHLQAIAAKLVLQERVLPPDPGPRSSTEVPIAKGASVDRFTAPADSNLLANPRLAEAPEPVTSVLSTGQGALGCIVNYILSPMYPQHMALAEY